MTQLPVVGGTAVVMPKEPLSLGRTFPVMEVFGPTVQGEGILAGRPTYFVRFGGCDYRCTWCDSKHAVIPAEVKAHAEKLTAHQIIGRVKSLARGPEWVTFSGGNPAMLKLGDLVGHFQNQGYRIAVETQGSLWKEWLGDVNCLTISPKPPSSGEAEKVERDLEGFMMAASLARPRRSRDALKIVVFDDADLAFAADVFARYPTWPRFLSCGTGAPEMPGQDGGEDLASTVERYRWLCEQVAGDERFANVQVFPQLHVIAWGHAKGV